MEDGRPVRVRLHPHTSPSPLVTRQAASPRLGFLGAMRSTPGDCLSDPQIWPLSTRPGQPWTMNSLSVIPHAAPTPFHASNHPPDGASDMGGKQELEKREKLSGEDTFSLLLFFVIVNGIIQSLELKLVSQVQTEQ